MLLNLKCWKCGTTFPFNAEDNDKSSANTVHATFTCPCDKKIECQVELLESEVPKQLVTRGGKNIEIPDAEAIRTKVFSTTPPLS
ncbi:hypothetical protein BGP_0166 [Beggiatoa sp. PS]|nr:hypothetical protein BGP_0166 [Beggiatoa sp. PS]